MMKLLKELIVCALFIGFGEIKPTQDAIVKTDAQLLQFLYSNYHQHKNDFVAYLPSTISIDECKQALRADKKVLKRKMNALSPFKDVALSKKGMINIGFFVAKEIVCCHSSFFSLHNSLSQSLGRDLAYYVLYPFIRTLSILQIIVLINLSQDVKVVSDKKKRVCEQYDKCTKMLALL